MKIYKIHQFNLPKIAGISEKTLENHLKLYEGYVKQTNALLEKLEAGPSPETMGLERRLAFEFDGMRNHEYYFESLEGGAAVLDETSSLGKAIAEHWGSFDSWLTQFKALAATRGIGWVILYYDTKNGRLVNGWVDEQQLGHLTGLTPLVMLDMWEHAYLMDYVSSEKGAYANAYCAALNWKTIASHFDAAHE